MRRVETTLLLLRKENQILLAMKKRGFGEGKFNGVGGKLEPDETAEQAMIREAAEEIFITPTKYEEVGIMEFHETYKGVRENLIFHLFVATKWDGEPRESEEMKPQWFDIDKIPYDKMFEDDRYWMPLILEGKKVNGFFEFDDNFKLLSHKVEEIKKEV